MNYSNKRASGGVKFNKNFAFFAKMRVVSIKKRTNRSFLGVVLLLFVLFMRWACDAAYGVCACR